MKSVKLTKLVKANQTLRIRKVITEAQGNRTRGYTWMKIRRGILARDCYTCRSCGRTGGELQVDHINPIFKGGTDEPANLQTLCVSCHAEKTKLELANGGY